MIWARETIVVGMAAALAMGFGCSGEGDNDPHGNSVVCQPLTTMCLGIDVIMCNGQGTDWVFYKTCNDGCVSGDCVDGEPNCPSDKECSGLVCGPDPICDESCGSCGSGAECQAGKCVPATCTPHCESSECGSGGCAGQPNACGQCPNGQNCDAGKCVAVGPICPEDADCTGLDCGTDPVCGKPCGTCTGTTACNEKGKCVTTGNYMEFELNGQTIAEYGFEGLHTGGLWTVSSDVASAHFSTPDWQILATLVVNDVSGAFPVKYGCGGDPIVKVNHRVDALTPWTGDPAEAFPIEWRSMGYSTEAECGEWGDDTIQTLSFDLTVISTNKAKGTYSITILGGGPRSGDTMVISGAFNIDFEPN